jgi:hypothetical protein
MLGKTKKNGARVGVRSYFFSLLAPEEWAVAGSYWRFFRLPLR